MTDPEKKKKALEAIEQGRKAIEQFVKMVDDGEIDLEDLEEVSGGMTMQNTLHDDYRYFKRDTPDDLSGGPSGPQPKQ